MAIKIDRPPSPIEKITRTPSDKDSGYTITFVPTTNTEPPSVFMRVFGQHDALTSIVGVNITLQELSDLTVAFTELCLKAGVKPTGH